MLSYLLRNKVVHENYHKRLVFYLLNDVGSGNIIPF